LAQREDQKSAALITLYHKGKHGLMVGDLAGLTALMGIAFRGYCTLNDILRNSSA